MKVKKSFRDDSRQILLADAANKNILDRLLVALFCHYQPKV
jgi:hypothetical protein